MCIFVIVYKQECWILVRLQVFNYYRNEVCKQLDWLLCHVQLCVSYHIAELVEEG